MFTNPRTKFVYAIYSLPSTQSINKQLSKLLRSQFWFGRESFSSNYSYIFRSDRLRLPVELTGFVAPPTKTLTYFVSGYPAQNLTELKFSVNSGSRKTSAYVCYIYNIDLDFFLVIFKANEYKQNFSYLSHLLCIVCVYVNNLINLFAKLYTLWCSVSVYCTLRDLNLEFIHFRINCTFTSTKKNKLLFYQILILCFLYFSSYCLFLQQQMKKSNLIAFIICLLIALYYLFAHEFFMYKNSNSDRMHSICNFLRCHLIAFGT